VTAIQSTTNLGMLLGPAVSGVAIAHVGVQNVLFLDAATFLVSTLCLIPIRMRHAVAPGPPQVARHVPGGDSDGLQIHRRAPADCPAADVDVYLLQPRHERVRLSPADRSAS